MKSLEFWLISSMLSSGLGGGGGVEPLLLGSGFPAHQAVTIEASRVTRPLTPGAGEGVDGVAGAGLLLKQTPGKGSVGLGLCVGADEGGGGEVSSAGLGVSGAAGREPDPLVSGVILVKIHIVRGMLRTAAAVAVSVGVGPGQG